MTQTDTASPTATVLPTAVVVDIDGTVATHALPDGRFIRGHHDYRLVPWDLPNPPVIETVRALHAAGLEIVFCSGRPVLDDNGWDVGRATRFGRVLLRGPRPRPVMGRRARAASLQLPRYAIPQ